MKLLKKSALLFCFAILIPTSGFSQEVLKLLVWEGYAPPDKVKMFEEQMSKKHGKAVHIDVSTKVSDPKEFFDAIRTEEGGVHIISPSHNLLKDERFHYIQKKLILEIDPKNIPNYKNLLPTLSQPEYMTEAGKTYGVPFAHGPYGIAYNTKYFDKAPDSIAILWDEKYKGRFCLSSDYYEANVFLTAMAMGKKGDAISDFDKLMNDTEFNDKLHTLAHNAKSFWTGVDKPEDLQGLSLGASWGFSLGELAKKGETWKMMEPKEGYSGWVDNFVISKNVEKNPFLKTIAEEWLNFVISPEYQTDVVVRGLSSDPVNTEAAKLMTKEEIERHHMNNPEYFSKNRVLWPVMSTRNRNGLKLLWQNAMKK